ncbi:hypothetical protein [Thauera sp. SDU_THAU2]
MKLAIGRCGIEGAETPSTPTVTFFQSLASALLPRSIENAQAPLLPRIF